MYWKAPDSKELAFFGLTAADVAGADVEIWPENELAFDIFLYMQTQWRAGMSGIYGLDYNVMFHKMDRLKLSEHDYAQLENDLRVMEAAALNEINRGSD